MTVYTFTRQQIDDAVRVTIARVRRDCPTDPTAGVDDVLQTLGFTGAPWHARDGHLISDTARMPDGTRRPGYPFRGCGASEALRLRINRALLRLQP
jgi:hypothetical protein